MELITAGWSSTARQTLSHHYLPQHRTADVKTKQHIRMINTLIPPVDPSHSLELRWIEMVIIFSIFNGYFHTSISDSRPAKF